MEWHDHGVIIGARKHGETSLILEVMTRGHGRHLGLVKGGRGKRMQPLLQPGNAVEVTWRARLEEHLGFYTVETTQLRAAELMERPASLHGLNLVCGLLRLLAEREPHIALFEATRTVLARLDSTEQAPALLVRFEAAVLADSGFGIDLQECAATGSRDDLIYVSPKSARAVSRIAGEPYKDRLLVLPAFLLRDGDAGVTASEIEAGFALTGFFLARDIYTSRGLPLPESRAAYLALLGRETVGPGEKADQNA
jgi:DNA repair protein RecO (recombination protein O)